MKAILITTSALAIAGCTHLGSYEGSDAALIPVPCDRGLITAENGKQYQRVLQIILVDGTFIGSGRQCTDNYVYRIRPGQRDLKVMANYVDSPAGVQRVAMINMTVTLSERGRYTLESGYDGKTAKVTFRDSGTGAVTADASTSEVKAQSLGNGAISALPFIVK
ncbi:hypothetical protein [Hydrogenophaga sp.]|uniref:hypothetical protein n=1 Tax=Hydrogenophaga sp. TaxID=1904254 RepID=UPI00286EA7E5|nr:hypothetical protein [Hydrogenophaga sp.]